MNSFKSQYSGMHMMFTPDNDHEKFNQNRRASKNGLGIRMSMDRASSIRTNEKGSSSRNNQLMKHYIEKRNYDMSPFRNSVNSPALRVPSSSGGGTEENIFKTGSSKREVNNSNTASKYVVKQTDKNIQAYKKYQKNMMNSAGQTSEDKRLMLHDSGIMIGKQLSGTSQQSGTKKEVKIS